MCLFALISQSVSKKDKKCGVKVVAIEQIKYKAVPVEVVDEGSRYMMTEATTTPPTPTKAPTPPEPPMNSRYKTQTTTKTMDMTEIFNEMMRDHRKTSTTPAPTTSPPRTTAAPPPAIYVMHVPPPVMPTVTPSTTAAPPTSINEMIPNKGNKNTYTSTVLVRPMMPSNPMDPSSPPMPPTYAQPVPVPGIDTNPYSGQAPLQPMYPMIPMRVTFKGLTTPAPAVMPPSTLPPTPMMTDFESEGDPGVSLDDDSVQGVAKNAIKASSDPSEAESEGSKKRQKSKSNSEDGPVMGVRIKTPMNQMQDQNVMNQLQQQMRNNIAGEMAALNGITPAQMLTSGLQQMSTSSINPELTFGDFIKGSSEANRRTSVFHSPHSYDQTQSTDNSKITQTPSETKESKYAEMPLNNHYEYDYEATDEEPMKAQETLRTTYHSRPESRHYGSHHRLQKRKRRALANKLSFTDTLLVLSLTSY